MGGLGRWTGEFSGAGVSRRRSIARAGHGGLFICAAAAALIFANNVAHGGPCTAQIAKFEQRIKQLPPGPRTGPTFSQTLGAQLHRQPTPQDVEHAESVAREQAQAAIERAKKADEAGNAEECNAALKRVRELYAIDSRQ